MGTLAIKFSYVEALDRAILRRVTCLCILFVEVLSRMISKSLRFMEIKLSDSLEIRISQYAIDTLLFVNGNTDDIK